MPLNALLAVVAGTVASYGAAWLIDIPVLVPVLNTLAAFPWLVRLLRRRMAREAIGVMLVWALVMGVCATALSYRDAPRSGRLFLNGEHYRREMFTWVRTGAGAEGDPRQFIPQHAAHAAIFGALAISTGSALAVPMGAILMNDMGHYVGALAAEADRPAQAVLLGWHPWSLVRVASFVMLGVILAGPVLSRLGRFRFQLREHRGWLWLALVGLLADVTLKWLLAPSWQLLLRRAAGW